MTKAKKLTLTILTILTITILTFIIGIKKYYLPQDINAIDLEEIKFDEFNLSKEDYLDDFNYAYHTLETYYPYFEINKKVNGIDWLANKDKYEKYISQAINDRDFYLRMNDVFNEINNWHTGLVDPSYGLYMYLTYYQLPLSNWRHDISRIYELENVRRRYNIDNKNIKAYIKNNISNSRENQTRSVNNNLTTKIIKKDKLALIKIKSMLGAAYRKNDEKVLAEFLKEIKDYPKLIIDIRQNGGGDSGYWQEFLLPKIINRDYQTKTYSFIKAGEINKKIINQENFKEDVKEFLDRSDFKKSNIEILEDFDYYSISNDLIRPSKDSIRFDGEIYLLVDGVVYSSSEMLASFCKETNLAKLIGVKTGGDGIGFDPMQVALPNSGYVLRFANNLGVSESGLINELEKTSPDVYIDGGLINSNQEIYMQKIIDYVLKD